MKTADIKKKIQKSKATAKSQLDQVLLSLEHSSVGRLAQELRQVEPDLIKKLGETVLRRAQEISEQVKSQVKSETAKVSASIAAKTQEVERTRDELLRTARLAMPGRLFGSPVKAKKAKGVSAKPTKKSVKKSVAGPTPTVKAVAKKKAGVRTKKS